MKIAIMGIRGIPVVYSGFESFVENFAPLLVKNGFKVYVYCREIYFREKIKEYKGVKLIFLPTIKNKYLETFFHTFISTLHAIFILKPKVIYYMNLGNAPIILLPKIFRIKTLFNPDGLDWKREKWGIFSKFYLLICEWLVTFLPDIVITDSIFMKEYYRNNYNKETFYIPYPFINNFKFNKQILKKFRLKKITILFGLGELSQIII